MPVFNSELTILKSVESILKQSFKDFEIIIIDGLSSDNTIKIIEGLKDNRIKIYSEKDRGTYDAMNKGIKYAKGHWLYFMGSDDYLYDIYVFQTISKKLKKIKRHVLYGNVVIKGNTGWAIDGQIYNGEYSFQKLLKTNICHQSIFYRRSFILDNGLSYNLKYPISADWDFNISCRIYSKFSYVNYIVAVFSAGGISSGECKSEPFIEDRKIKYAHLYARYRPSLLQLLVKKLKLKFRFLNGLYIN